MFDDIEENIGSLGVQHHNYPLAEILEIAEDLIKKGAIVYQKFTCGNCGNRLTMEEPNTFYKAGTCDDCGHETNIEETGCNYLLYFNVTKKT